MTKLAQALAAAHAKGVIHRDLKPNNVMMCAGVGPVVMDFGLAKQTRQQDRKLTQMGTMMGTPAYMPPEQVKGELDRMGPASDVYSLGVILFRVADGAAAVRGRDGGGGVRQDPVHRGAGAVVVAAGAEPALDAICSEGDGQGAGGPLCVDEGVRRRPDRVPQGDAAGGRGGQPEAAKTGTADISQARHGGPEAGESGAADYGRRAGKGSALVGVVRGETAPPPIAVVAGKSGGGRPWRTIPGWALGALLTLGGLGVVAFFWMIFANRPAPSTPPVRASLADAITNSIGMKLKLIKEGAFKMGSPDSEKDAQDDEKPRHEVEITPPFYLGVYPVTKGQFAAFVSDADYRTEAERAGDESNLARSELREQTDDDPVVCVSWNDAVKFCDWLRKKENKTYGLPTEAEWEYACRAGTTTAYFFGDDPKMLGDYAWYYDNSEHNTHPVGGKRPNPWGLYDMHGNVWQWCAGLLRSEILSKQP